MSAPRITVVTPSFNQAAFLERTIESVRAQNYSNLEHIIIDGGSSDGSVALIQKHARHLAYWCSEPDRGQSHAINKGLARSTGEILCWLNSDDYLASDTLRLVASVLGGRERYAMTGHHVHVSPQGQPIKVAKGEFVSRRRLLEYWSGYGMHQPSTFWRREVYEKVGPLDERLHLVMDYDYWLRISRHFAFENIDRVLSYGHRHPAAKTADEFFEYTFERRRHARSRWHEEGRVGRVLLQAQEAIYGRALFASRLALMRWRALSVDNRLDGPVH